MKFDDPGLIERLEAVSPADLDRLAFGVVGFGSEGMVELYNTYEADAAGLTQNRVLGRHFFFDIAPCMNNYMVAERLEHEEKLDDIIPYVLTFRMRPTPARLRLLRMPEYRRRYVLVERI